MAISHVGTQVEWSGADYLDLTSGAPTGTSDVEALNTGVIRASLQLKAKNQGTPADGDTVDFWVLYSCGDPDLDPDDVDEYDTVGHAAPLRTLDTKNEDPAIVTIPIIPAVKAFAVYASSNAASNTIRVAAQLYDIRDT